MKLYILWRVKMENNFCVTDATSVADAAKLALSIILDHFGLI